MINNHWHPGQEMKSSESFWSQLRRYVREKRRKAKPEDLARLEIWGLGQKEDK